MRLRPIWFIALLAAAFAPNAAFAKAKLIEEPLTGPNCIREWLLAAVPNTGTANVEGVNTDWIKKYLGITESEFATVEKGPSAGDKLTGQRDFDWRVARTETGMLDIDAAIQPGVDNNNITAYLFVYVTSPNNRTTTMYVGSDDCIVVWVNGKEVWRNPVLRGASFDQDKFTVRLRKGKNAVMLKVVEQGGGWKAAARFENSKGLRFSTDKRREGKELPPTPVYIRNWLIVTVPNPQPSNAVGACNTDLIKEASRGKLTEEKVAKYGVEEGDKLGDEIWTAASLLSLSGNNINDMVNTYMDKVGDHNDITLYALAEVYSPDRRNTDLLVGSDDCVVVWLNGEEVWRNPVLRGMTIDQDRVPVTLKPGKNLLMVKVSEQGGGWAMTVRFEDAQGLRFSIPGMFQAISPEGKLPTTLGGIKSGRW